MEDNKVSDERLKRYATLYRMWWRDDPPPGYLESVASSMNLIEFEAHERAKPAFAYSPFAKEQEAGMASQVLKKFGGQGG